MAKLFGTDGIRGIAYKELTIPLAFKVGVSLSQIIKKCDKKPLVVIGKDTRFSSTDIENAIVYALSSSGIDVVRFGVIPTPAISFLVQHYDATFGVMVTASHNPYIYNGIKVFDNYGNKITEEMEQDIEDYISSMPKIVAIDNFHMEDFISAITIDTNGRTLYINRLKSAIKTLKPLLSKRKIVFDCANGAVGDIAREVFSCEECEIIEIGNNPDGKNINNGCGSTMPELLQKSVLQEHADFGIAFDGDGDRVLLVDKLGNEIDCDKLIIACALYLKKNCLLKNNKTIVTIASNTAVNKILAKEDIQVERCNVGDKNVLFAMDEQGCNFGGEKSGHIIFSDYFRCSDGVLSAILACSVLFNQSNDIIGDIELTPQVEKNVPIDKGKLDDQVQQYGREKFKAIQNKLDYDNCELMIRVSGTEPIIRIKIEGENQEFINAIADSLKTKITEKYA